MLVGFGVGWMSCGLGVVWVGYGVSWVWCELGLGLGLNLHQSGLGCSVKGIPEGVEEVILISCLPGFRVMNWVSEL